MLLPALTNTNISASNDNGPANKIKNSTIISKTNYRHSANPVIRCLDSALDNAIAQAQINGVLTIHNSSKGIVTSHIDFYFFKLYSTLMHNCLPPSLLIK
jgi:hypothetical protein